MTVLRIILCIIRLAIRLILLPVRVVLTLLMMMLSFAGGVFSWIFGIVGIICIIGGICGLILPPADWRLFWWSIAIGSAIGVFPTAATILINGMLYGIKKICEIV